MALTAAPTAPDIADQSTFQARSQAWVIYIKDTLIPELNAIIGTTIPAGSAAASTLTGNTLAANVLASSLTSLGTIAALVVGTAAIGTKPLARGSGVISVTGATTIDVAASGSSVTFSFITGDTGPSVKGFADILVWPGNAQPPAPIYSVSLYGAADARTYTTSGTSLDLAMAAGTYNVRILSFDMRA